MGKFPGFGKKKKPLQPVKQQKKYESSDDDSDDSSSSSEEANRVSGYEYQKAPTKRGGDDDYSDYRPEFSSKVSDLPVGTQFVVLPEVGNDVLQDEGDFSELYSQVQELKKKVNMLEEILNNSVFATDDGGNTRRFQSEMEEVLLFTAILHKRLTCSVAPGLDKNDFLKEERETYEKVSTELFQQLARISSIKTKFNNFQQSKLKKTMRIVNPDLTEDEINQQMEMALLEGDDLLADSSNLFTQQIVDDRYKREEAKIALMYAREQKKELEQIERSIAQLHQMSVDLAALVQGQGEILDQMEMSISNSVQDSIKGLKMLEVAEAHKISSRKKKIIIGVILAVVIGVTILTIAGVTAGVIALCA